MLSHVGADGLAVTSEKRPPVLGNSVQESYMDLSVPSDFEHRRARTKGWSGEGPGVGASHFSADRPHPNPSYATFARFCLIFAGDST